MSAAVAGALVLFSLAAFSNAAAQSTRPNYSAADVKFMQAMISHHTQALAMTALVPGRTTREDIRLLAERIEVSQKDEIALMKQWLADQLVRGIGIRPDRAAAVARDLDRAERLKGARQRTALTQLATQLDRDTRLARDSARVRALAATIRELAKAKS